MELIEILGIIILILLTFLSAIVIYLAFFKEAFRGSNIDGSIVDEMHVLEKNLKSEISDGLIRFNNEVNKQLIHISDLSGEHMAQLRIKVNQQLADFQEKLSKGFHQEFHSLNESFQKQMHQINEKVDMRLEKGFKNANETFMNIAKRVEVIDQAQENIKSLSEEMVSLQNILSNNQSRGAFGEYQLNQLLYSVYGHNQKLYQTQYTIKANNKSVRADAVIFMPKPNAMIAIDSKFPYASYAKLFDDDIDKETEKQLIAQFGRDIKKHITDIANKYVMPPITTDYALMFVPSDGILSLLHSRLEQLVEYARDHSVTIVSPTTIIPLLSSFKAFVIDYERSKNMEKINQELIKLGRDFKNFGKEWAKLNRAIQTVKKDSDQFDQRIERMYNKFDSIKNAGMIESEGDDQG